MKIFYRRNRINDLKPWGIKVPIKDRPAAIISFLKSKNLPDEKYRILDDSPSLDRTDLLRVHSPIWVDTLFCAQENECFAAIAKTYEFDTAGKQEPRFQPNLVKKTFSSLCQEKIKEAAGTYQTALFSAKSGQNAYYLSGGMHHAMPYGGRGFCLINDIMIALKKLLAEKNISTAWVIDTDAHKGDGTAVIAKSEPSIKTFSIHMCEEWPLTGPEYDGLGNRLPWFTPNTIDVGVPRRYAWRYIDLLRGGLAKLATCSPVKKPDLCIVVAGADPYEHDALLSGKGLDLSAETLLKRDQIVHQFLQKQKIPATWLLAGGYGEKAYEIPTQFLNSVYMTP